MKKTQSIFCISKVKSAMLVSVKTLTKVSTLVFLTLPALLSNKFKTSSAVFSFFDVY